MTGLEPARHNMPAKAQMAFASLKKRIRTNNPENEKGHFCSSQWLYPHLIFFTRREDDDL